MPKRERLLERQDLFVFEFKPSEINYGGKMRFHQVAFPPPDSRHMHIEYLIFKAVNHFSLLLEDRFSETTQTLASKYDGLSTIFLDLWGAIPQIRFQRFHNWYSEDVLPIAGLYQKTKQNALSQEKSLGVHKLHYFTSLSIISLLADIITEYFEKHIDRLGRLATTARWILGRTFTMALLEIEDDSNMKRQCTELLDTPEQDVSTRRVINPFIIAFADAADAGLIDEILLGPNPYKVPSGLRKKVNLIFTKIIQKSKRFEASIIKRCLSESGNFFKMMQDRVTKNRIIRAVRKDKQVRMQIIFENVKSKLQQLIKNYMEQQEAGQPLMLFAANDKRLSELLLKKPVRKQFLKLFKHKHSKLTENIKQELNSSLKLINKSKKGWFGRLNRKELVTELEIFQERLALYLAQAEDFRIMRTHYGQDSNQGAKWLGLKLWRSYELVFNKMSVNDKDRFQFNNVWEKKRVDTENNFAEGNMYLIRPQGEIYARDSGRRTNVIFMFADLRNSTETTMKLTKDTASYLTPYLTAVNTSAKQCRGTRIYFAGDGFAAYFNKIADAIRASYIMDMDFGKLRKASGEESVKKAKEIYQQARALVNEIQQPEKVREALDKNGDYIREEVKSFLMDIAKCDTAGIDEAVLKKLLAKAAVEYSMPRIDVGIALTGGELFNAMVGEDGEDKIPIVISPQLTQAARLSGSSELVKKYIDSNFPQPFPYNVYARDKKLYNRGIVITSMVFAELKQEVGIYPIKTKQSPFHLETLYYYEDEQLKRRVIFRESGESVMLKGIKEPCEIFEVATPGSALDKTFGRLEGELI